MGVQTKFIVYDIFEWKYSKNHSLQYFPEQNITFFVLKKNIEGSGNSTWQPVSHLSVWPNLNTIDLGLKNWWIYHSGTSKTWFMHFSSSSSEELCIFGIYWVLPMQFSIRSFNFNTTNLNAFKLHRFKALSFAYYMYIHILPMSIRRLQIR